MASVDGRLIPSLWTPPFDGTDPGLLFNEYAHIGVSLGTDAWMFGKATTAEMFPRKYETDGTGHAKAGSVYLAPRRSSRLFITIDPEADILYTSGALRGDDMAVVVDTIATTGYLDMLKQNGISYVVLDNATDLTSAVKAIHRYFGINSISLQGGGIIDGAMLAAGLLDELSLVVYPGIDGNSLSPSVFEYVGEGRAAHGQALEFVSAEVLPHGIVWMRYRFVKLTQE